MKNKKYTITIAILIIIIMVLAGKLFERSDDEPFISYIPLPSPAPTEYTNPSSQASDTDKININTASKEELMTLDGIGPSFAEKIIAYRSEHGSFARIEDIMLISGISTKRFENIKNSISVN